MPKEIKYDKRNTFCPYGKTIKFCCDEYTVKVGGGVCKQCDYNKGIDFEKHIVKCSCEEGK